MAFIKEHTGKYIACGADTILENATNIEPDSITISKDANGILSAKKATNSSIGVVKGDGLRVLIDQEGTITIPNVTNDLKGLTQAGDGLNAVNGYLNVKPNYGLAFNTNQELIVTPETIDITEFKNADTLVLGKFREELNSSSNLETLSNSQKGDFWIVSESLTISGVTFNVADQLWCKTTFTGTPTDLTNFSKVPFTIVNATTSFYGTVKLGNTLPLKPGSATIGNYSLGVAAANHVHPLPDEATTTNAGLLSASDKAKLNGLATYIGDVKSSYITMDHGGWIILNGRNVSTLTSTQISAAATLGWTTTIPDERDSFSVMAGTSFSLGTKGGSPIIARSDLPNIDLATNLSISYTPSGVISIGNTISTNNLKQVRNSENTAWEWPSYSYLWYTMIVKSNSGFGGFNSDATNTLSGDGSGAIVVNNDVSASDLSYTSENHTHNAIFTGTSSTLTLPSIRLNGNVNQTNYMPKYVAHNRFVYLGA